MTELEKTEYYYAYLDGKHTMEKYRSLPDIALKSGEGQYKMLSVEYMYFLRGAKECMNGRPLLSKEELFQSVKNSDRMGMQKTLSATQLESQIQQTKRTLIQPQNS